MCANLLYAIDHQQRTVPQKRLLSGCVARPERIWGRDRFALEGFG